MNKSRFAKVFPQVRFGWNHVAWSLGLAAAVLGMGWVSGCAKPPSEPVIAVIAGQPVYLREMEIMGRVALGQAGLKFDTPEGQAYYKKIAPNLYKSVIDIYVLKYSAEQEIPEPSAEQVEADFKQFKENLQRDGQYQRFMTSLNLTEEHLKDSIRDRLRIEELKNQKFSGGDFVITDDEIKEFYYQNHASFRYPQVMRASHIFAACKVEEGAEKRQKARLRAEELLKMVGPEPSKTFVGLAQRYSDDKGTAPRGGDLGFFDREGPGLNEPFKQAAFALKEGEVSGVVETDYGYHIIWATDHEQSLEEARNFVREILVQKKKTERFVQWLEEASQKIKVTRLFDPVKFEVVKEEKPDAK
ncbi:MAG: peptidylprolyl isomerase [bacterium]